MILHIGIIVFFNKLLLTHQFLDRPSNNTNCPDACYCSEGSIDCSEKQLLDFPDIQSTGKGLLVFLSGNNLTTIPSQAFGNVRTRKLEIYLNTNLLSSISIAAFDGVQNVTSLLDLGGNQLNALPQALAKLTNLKTLYIWGNPISVFDANVMHNIGLTLETFGMGSSALQRWPYEVYLLRKVKEFHINDLILSDLPHSAFHGMENSLRNLFITNTSLRAVPFAICKLRKLRTFDLVGNHHFDIHEPLLKPCNGGPLTTVAHVTMQENNLLLFPSMFAVFPNATILYVTKNPNLRFIAEENIPSNTQVSLLELYGNGFYQIPAVIMKMKALRTINLMNNSIVTIESNDIQDLPRLGGLILKNNPIRYISKYAFSNLPSLTSIDLSNTYLTTFPQFISTTISPLTHFYLQATNIECTCDLLWLEPVLNNRSVTIYGNCESFPEKLQDYINISLPLCVS